MATDPRFATKGARLQNREALDQRVAAAFAERTLAEWEPILTAAGAIYGAVRTWDEVFRDPQVVESLVHDVPHTAAGNLRMIGNPLKFTATPADIRLPPPMLGEHSEEVMANPGQAWR
jgi:formyl-CoA transferase